MSRSNSRAISYSRSQTSFGTSVASRQSNIPNYHQIAIELVSGAPLDIVSQRDLRNVLIELSVLRSEANDIKDFVKSDNIKEIIIGLNNRIKPPPIRYTTYTSPKNSPKGKSEIGFSPNDTLESENFKSPLRPKISLSKEEFNKISKEIDEMLETSDNKSLSRILSNFNELDYLKYHLVINNRREKCLSEFRYKDLKLLDTLSDKLRQPFYDSNIRRYNDKIEELRARIDMSYVKISSIEMDKNIQIQKLMDKKEQELEKLRKRHEDEMNEFKETNNIESQIAINRQSIALKEMRLNERLAAMDRDYQGAEKIHKNANIKEAEEKAENSLRFEETISKKKEKLENKQMVEINCMGQWFDYLIMKEQNQMNEEINVNMAAIKSAEIQISQIENKIKRISKSHK